MEIVVPIAVAMILFGWRPLKHYLRNAHVRRLRAAQHYPSAQLPATSPGRVVGTVHGLTEMLTAPLSGRPCVYYIVTVKEDGRTIVEAFRGVPFVIIDASGRTIVDPEGANITLNAEWVGESGWFVAPTPAQQAFLDRASVKSQAWLLYKSLHYHEAVITIGQTISVLGHGIHEPDPDAMPTGGYRDAQPTRLRLSSSAALPLVISDDPAATR